MEENPALGRGAVRLPSLALNEKGALLHCVGGLA